MSAEERHEIVFQAEFCISCLSPEVIFTYKHVGECNVRKKAWGKEKSPYTCTFGKCARHLWICKFHKLKNGHAIQQTKQDLQRKGLVMGYPAVLKTPIRSGDAVRAAKVTKSRSVGMRAVSGNKDTEEVKEEVLGNGVSSVKSDERGKLRKFFSKARRKGMDVVPEPEGRPLFLFFAAKGRNKPVQVFFDSGCSDAVMREGIPGVEWQGIITKRGPFGMGGIGGLSSTTKDEWMVLVPREDGKMQAVRGYSMNKVTCDFPQFDLTRAVAAVKEDAPDNKVLQSCKLPSKVGGEVDCLLGIKYSFIHPEPIHILVESGLCIYRSKLKSHDGITNAMIGGPHESFDLCANMAGGVAQLMAHFTEGLQRFTEGAVPRIGTNPLCMEEIEYAKKAEMAIRGFYGIQDCEHFWEGSNEDLSEVIVNPRGHTGWHTRRRTTSEERIADIEAEKVCLKKDRVNNDLSLQLREDLVSFEKDMVSDTETETTPDDGELRVGDVFYLVNKETDAMEQVPTSRYALTTERAKRMEVATTEQIVDLNRNKVFDEDDVTCKGCTNSFQNSPEEIADKSENVALTEGTEDPLGIKIDVVRINLPPLDFDSCGRGGVCFSAYGEYGKVCFGKKTLMQGVRKTAKVVEGWDELTKRRKDLEFKEKSSTMILAHDRHPSLEMMLMYLGNGEHITKQTIVKVLTPDIQLGVVVHREDLAAISVTTERSDCNKTVSVFDRGRTILNMERGDIGSSVDVGAKAGLDFYKRGTDADKPTDADVLGHVEVVHRSGVVVFTLGPDCSDDVVQEAKFMDIVAG